MRPVSSTLAALVPGLAACAAFLVVPRAAAQTHVLFEVDGTRPNQHFGYSVAAAGDVNGDGTPDLLVGEIDLGGLPPAPHALRILSGVDGSLLFDPFPANCKDGADVAGLGDIDGDGVSDVVFGLPWGGTFEVRSGATGALIFSDGGVCSFFGFAVNAAGDVNADGTPDVVVGSGVGGFWDYGGDVLRVYSGTDGSLLHEINEYNPTWWPQSIGFSVAGLGDVNGDGFGDIASGRPLNGQGWLAGSVLIYSGADFSVIDGVGAPTPNTGLGWVVANVGDFDGDGVDDFAATTHWAEDFAAVYSGATRDTLLFIDDLPLEPHSNVDIDGLGDIDGDGHRDLVVGGVGAVLFYSGDDGKLLMRHALPVDSSAYGPNNYVAVAAAGDLDGDGRDDVIAGDHRDDGGAIDAGRILVISSKPEPWTDLGFALAGGGTPPSLSGAGTLAAGSPGFVRLLDAPPSAPGILFVGLTALQSPFKGGTLVPAPTIVLNLTSSPSGSFLLAWSHWPAGLPGFFHLWFQAWIADPAAPAGAAASNALLATTPA
jgi:hypothetical protein